MSGTDSTTNTSSSSSTAPVKKSGPVRLPTLNQLAARISSNAGKELPNPQASSTAAPRPRLATSVLRGAAGGSSTSINTVTSSTVDSMAVNVPSTRAASPAISNASTSTSAAANEGTPVPSGGEPLTEEKLEKLNQETGSSEDSTHVNGNAKIVAPAEVPAPRKKVGYKNIPSLDAITNHLKTKLASQISVDGSVQPPEVEMIEDPKTPGVPIRPPEHPLQFPWTIYHDTKAKYPYTPATASTGSGFNQPAPGTHTSSLETPVSAAPIHPPEGAEYEAGLTIIGEFDTVEEFCRYFNWLKPPSKLEKNSNYHIFKSGIKPMWEDPANANGGKWVLTMKNSPALLDRCWTWLAMALVGEELEDNSDEICGAVVSLRSKVDRIQVWTRSKDDVEKLNGIAKRLVKLLDVSEADGIGLEFQYNSDDRPPPNKFITIQSAPMSSFRGSFQGPPGAGHSSTRSFGGSGDASGLPGGSAFGSFGTGAGIGGQTWKAGPKRA